MIKRWIDNVIAFPLFFATCAFVLLLAELLALVTGYPAWMPLVAFILDVWIIRNR